MICFHRVMNKTFLNKLLVVIPTTKKKLSVELVWRYIFAFSVYGVFEFCLYISWTRVLECTHSSHNIHKNEPSRGNYFSVVDSGMVKTLLVLQISILEAWQQASVPYSAINSSSLCLRPTETAAEVRGCNVPCEKVQTTSSAMTWK